MKKNSRRCEVCKIVFNRASYAKLLKVKKQSEKLKNVDMIIPEWLIQETVKKRTKKLYDRKPLKQLERNIIQLDDNELNRELAKKMLVSYYFTDRNLKIGFNISLDSHHINHSNSNITSKPLPPEFGIEFRHTDEILKDMAIIYAKLLNQYKYKYQTVFSAR